jgi:flagellar basal-body rod modification protein FlgD
MATAAGIWSHSAGASPAGVTALDNSAGSTASGTSSDSATISANDFLTLLVTEMKNQDPTADNDPNQYINQLVNVNSLEQLIGINQTLSAAYPGSKTGTGTSGVTGGNTGTKGTPDAVSSIPSPQRANSVSSNVEAAAVQTLPQRPAAQIAPGNLSVPGVNPAAQRVAQALSGNQGTFTP